MGCEATRMRWKPPKAPRPAGTYRASDSEYIAFQRNISRRKAYRKFRKEFIKILHFVQDDCFEKKASPSCHSEERSDEESLSMYNVKCRNSCARREKTETEGFNNTCEANITAKQYHSPKANKT